MPYHVFISYRRDTGDTMARFLYDRLKDDGYQPFLDVEQMRSGRFNTQLYERIAECEDFLLILSPHALDRCRHENDWLRMEILEALRLHKNIVPFILRDFEFPSEPRLLQRLLGGQQLPREILDLRYFQGVAASQEYFDSAFARLKALLYYQPELLAPAPSAPTPSPAESAAQEAAAPINADGLLDRAFLFLEDGQFGRADVCLEQVLNHNPRCARAYLAKLMIEYRQHRPEHLAELRTPISQSRHYEKIMRFGDAQLQEQVRAYNQAILSRMDPPPAPERPEAPRDPIPSEPPAGQTPLHPPCTPEPPGKASRPAGSRTLLTLVTVLLGMTICLAALWTRREAQIQQAMQLFRDGHSRQAMELTGAWPEACYRLAQYCLQQGQKGYACLYFMKAGDYRDSREQMRALQRMLDGKITAGSFFTAAVAPDGSVLYTGNTERPSAAASWQNVRALVASDQDIVGIREDGSLLYTDTPFDPVKGSPYVTVGAMQTGFFAVAEDGSVFVHHRQYGTDANIALTWPDTVAADGYHLNLIALQRDGTVRASVRGLEHPLPDWRDIVDVSIGRLHYIGLKEDGTLVAAGSNEDHQCDVGDWQDIVAIACEYNTTYGLKSDGTVVTTDAYLSAQLASWRDIVAISAGFNHVVGLQADGTVVAVGYNSDHEAGQREVAGWDLLD